MLKKRVFRKAVIIVFWLCIWQLAAIWTDNVILLVGPWQVGKAFVCNAVSPDFIKTIIFSFSRIGLGFFLALFCGSLLGALSAFHSFLEELLAPVMAALKSIPVASFVVLLLIWFGSAKLSFFISFLIVFPNVYVNVIAGLQSTDKKLLEMAEVFGITGFNRFLYIYRPALMPYLKSCLKVSLGMSFKSGVAAEVIGMPSNSLGERLYLSKIYLDTAGLFAWTLCIILLSFLFEKAVLYLVQKAETWNPYPIRSLGKQKGSLRSDRIQENRIPSKKKIQQEQQDIQIRHLDKSYDGQQVLTDFNMTIKQGGRYCLMAASGSGKTTLLRLLCHLESPEGGQISGNLERIGMVFQEDRLCEECDTICNIMLTSQKKKEEVWKEAVKLLPEECLHKPVKELSGGMRRRCAILRAMLSEADIFILDEPFNGLDEENREKTALYILEHLAGRTLLVTTHRKEDVALLQGEKVEWT